MNERDFQKAKDIALGLVRSWLPDGRQEGQNWVAKNPNIAHTKYGAFKVNTDTGAWADFSDADAKGNDCIGLYVYLNESRLAAIASKKNYKNTYGGMKTEAAEEILIANDHSYFPDNEKYEPRDSTVAYWDGFVLVERGVDHPPALDLTWYRGKWGTEEKIWYFKQKEKTVMACVRFRDDTGKKDDRPFTLWQRGELIRWRSKGLTTNVLYNVDELTARPNDLVILTEGQKKADMLIGLPGFVSVGWYGGAGNSGKTDWSPLVGREVYFCFDSDIPGRNALNKIKEFAKEYTFKLHPVFPPAGVKSGWGLDDAIDAGWDHQKIIDFIMSDKEPDEEKYLDDIGAYNFKILGYQGDNIVFYSYESNRIVKQPASTLTKGFLLTLMDRKQYGLLYKKDDGGIAWESCSNDILRRVAANDIFDPKSIRTSGVWWDDGRIVIHCGSELFVDGKATPLEKIESRFVYEKGKKIPYMDETPISSEEAAKLMDMIKPIQFEQKADYEIIAGWCLIAPFCGIFDWRSHVWLTGPTGCGKSYVLKNLLHDLVGKEFAVCGRGKSTAAGPRTALNNSKMPLIMDEMESDTEAKAILVQQHIDLLRDASSGSDAAFPILHGSQDSIGKSWNIETMGFFASIGASLKHNADLNRFTVLIMKDLKKIDTKEKEENWILLQEQLGKITQSWARAFHARTASIIRDVYKCVQVFITQATQILGNRRDGDQLGTLLAGAWMVCHDQSATAAEAYDYMVKLNVRKFTEECNEKMDCELIFDTIKGYKVTISEGSDRSSVTIGIALKYWFALKGLLIFGKKEDLCFSGGNEKSIKQELEAFGIKPSTYSGIPTIAIAHKNIGMKKLLHGSGWTDTYTGMIKKSDSYLRTPNGTNDFAGVHQGYDVFDATKILEREYKDEIPLDF